MELTEHLDFLFCRIDWETELLSKTIIGQYLLRGITGVITCDLLEGISKENKQKNPQQPNHS